MIARKENSEEYSTMVVNKKEDKNNNNNNNNNNVSGTMKYSTGTMNRRTLRGKKDYVPQFLQHYAAQDTTSENVNVQTNPKVCYLLL